MRFYTIGYGNRRPDDFFDTIARFGAKVVLDVRIRPTGRLSSYKLAKDPQQGIQRELSARGVRYAWIPELGNPYKDDKEGWRPKYQAMLESVWEIQYPLLLTFAQPACIMCCCLKVEACHREYISMKLQAEGHEVVHL